MGPDENPWRSGIRRTTRQGRLKKLKVLALITVGVIALVGSPFQHRLMSLVGIYAIAVLGLNVFMGYTGQVSFGHNVFLGIGAYASALSTVKWEMAPLTGIAIGVCFAVLVALAVAASTSHLSGHYLALATFAVGIGFYSLVANTQLVGGFVGIPGIPPLRLGGWVIESVRGTYIVTWMITIAVAVLMGRLTLYRFGRALLSVDGDEPASLALGIPVRRIKIQAFTISAAITAVAGSLLSHANSFMSPEFVGLPLILSMFVILFLGGLGSIAGTIAAALAFVAVPYALTGLDSWRTSIFSVALIVILILKPRGLLSSDALKGSYPGVTRSPQEHAMTATRDGGDAAG